MRYTARTLHCFLASSHVHITCSYSETHLASWAGARPCLAPFPLPAPYVPAHSVPPYHTTTHLKDPQIRTATSLPIPAPLSRPTHSSHSPWEQWLQHLGFHRLADQTQINCDQILNETKINFFLAAVGQLSVSADCIIC